MPTLFTWRELLWLAFLGVILGFVLNTATGTHLKEAPPPELSSGSSPEALMV